MREVRREVKKGRRKKGMRGEEKRKGGRRGVKKEKRST